jgi:CRISPR/Cas system-associated protein Cas10 (large subunit of type III CRISPR-Cas system)
MPYLTNYRVVQCGATEYKGTTLGTTNQAFWYILLHLIEIEKWLKCLFYKGFEAKRRKRGMIIDNSTYPKVAVQWLNQALYFYQSLCLVDSEVLRNRHLRVAAKR